LAVAKERTAMSKQAVQKMNIERFNFKELNEGEVKNSMRLQSQTSVQYNGEINRAWDTIRENTTISAKESLSYCESEHHKPWFAEECSKLVD
jgi:hypothetical protein